MALTSFARILEINVGIICASLLTFPAFLERHGPKSLGSSFGRLLSRISTWLEQRFSRLHSSRSGNTAFKPDRNPAQNLPLDPRASEYARLREKNGAAEIDMGSNRGKESSLFRQDRSSDDDDEAEKHIGLNLAIQC